MSVLAARLPWAVHGEAGRIARPPQRPAPKLSGLEVPRELWAREPPEARGLPRDGVRLMVSEVETDRVRHGAFRDLPAILQRGDLLVVNASATINAALAASWEGGERAGKPVALHLSTPLPGGSDSEWVVELREPTKEGTHPLFTARVGDRLRLADGAGALLRAPYSPAGVDAAGRGRLWVAELALPAGTLQFAGRHGRPIRYAYVRDPWPLSMYRTIFGAEPGSAEMPSAGRPFSRAVLDDLEDRGIRVAPLVLHTGVASLEAEEAPYPERYRVPVTTAQAVDETRRAGGRTIAVGTTVLRALETVTGAEGQVRPGEGWTDLVITPGRGIRSVDGLLTGFHEPTSSHLAILHAFAGTGHVEATYGAALEGRYLWHEFGDVHLLLRRPGSRAPRVRKSIDPT